MSDDLYQRPVCPVCRQVLATTHAARALTIEAALTMQQAIVYWHVATTHFKAGGA